MKKRILSLMLVCATLLTAIPMAVLPVAAVEADTFTPTTRFVLVSDIHVAKGSGANAGVNVDHMMNRVYSYLDEKAEKNDNLLPSAIISMGDSLNDGYPEEADYLAARFNKAKAGFLEKYGKELPIYAIMGNHEYNNGYYYDVNINGANKAFFEYVPRTEGMSTDDYVLQNTAAFREAFISKLWGTAASAEGATTGNVGAIDNNTTDWHYVINGMHFIGISISNHLGNLSTETMQWLDDELAKATADTPDAPIFLFSHHPLRDTLHSTDSTISNQWSHYMPDNKSWGLSYHNQTHTQFTNIIKKYPNVIFSTGHTHAPGNAPLGIWQGEDENGNGTGFTAYCPGGLVSSCDFAIIEIDAKNTVRFYPQHVNGAYTNPDGSTLYYEVSYNNDGTHSYGYNETARTAAKPEFAADQTATFSDMWASDGKVTGMLSFGQAVSGAVYPYTYEIAFVPQGEGTTIYATASSNAFARSLNIPTTVHSGDFELEEDRVYDVHVTPLNYWGGRGETKVLLADLKTPSSELKETDSSYTSLYTHPTSGTGVNDHTYSLEDGTVTFAPAWSVGAYSFDNGGVYPYSYANKPEKEAHGYSSLSTGLSWQYGGMYLDAQSETIIAGHNKDSTHMATYVTYTAEKSGTLNLTIDNMNFHRVSTAYALVKNYSTVISANNVPFVNWDATAEENPNWTLIGDSKLIQNKTYENIEVKKGDTISFVFSRGSVDDGWGIYNVKMHVDYTKEKETVNYVYESAFVQKPGTETYPTIDYDTLIKDGTYPHYALVQHPAWELGCYYFGTTTASVNNGRNPYNVYTSQYKLITRNGIDMWGYGGGYFNSNFTIPSQNNYVTYIAYVAEKDGVLDLEVTDLKFKYANTAYAIVKNFSEVLTTDEVVSFVNWTSDTRENWEYSQAVGTSTKFGVTKVSVKKGDTIAIVFDRAELKNGDGYYDLNMTVKYRKEYVGDAITYEHKTNGKNFPVVGRDTDGFPLLAAGELDYEMGTYKFANSTAYPYGTSTDIYGIIASKELGGCWAYGGMYHDGKMIVPAEDGYVSYIAYTADCDGKLDISISNLTFQREGTAFTVVRNFKDVLLANGGTLANYTTTDTADYWYHSVLGQTYSFTIRDVEVKMGDTVAIVFDNGLSQTTGYNSTTKENQRGPKSMNIDMQYSERYASIYTSAAVDSMEPIKSKPATVDWSNSIWTPVVYKNRNDAGVADKALMLDTYYGACHAYVNSSYSKDVTGSDGVTQSYAMLEVGTHSEWGPLGAMVITSQSAAGYRYIAEESGNVRFAFDKAGAQSSSVTAAEIVMGYAIFVNGVKVWPYGDNQWYNMRQDSRVVDYTEELNAAMPQALFVSEGDCIEILARNDNAQSNSWIHRGNIFLPKVTYDSETMVSAVLNDKFAITLYPAGELADGQSATLNGESVTPTLDSDGGYTIAGIAAKEMGDTIVWQYAYADTAFARGDRTVTVPHVAQQWQGSYADLMKAYIDAYAADTSDLGVAITDLAVATLNYGAAAQTYFGYKTDSLVNAVLSDEQKTVTHGTSYETAAMTQLDGTPTAELLGATLLLNDRINIKLLVSSSVEGARLQIADNADFTGTGVSTIDFVAENETTLKAIMDGLSPAIWNTSFYFRVVDADGTAISHTLRYSVAAYCQNMINKQDEKVTPVANAILALYDAVAAYTA